MIHYVQQEDADGCLVACCAMVLGIPYREARATFARSGRLSEIEADELLGQCGIAMARRYRFDPVRNAFRDAWPPEPFAPLHWALVETAAGGHAVVMLADGAVLDPARVSRTTLRDPAYLQVYSVTGLWRVADATVPTAAA